MVRRNQISDESLSHLADSITLRSLNLTATRISNAGFRKYLPEMPQLQELALACTHLGDSGLAALASLSWLERVNLKHTAISRNAIVEFVNEKSHALRRLNLANTSIDDDALSKFPTKSELYSLSLVDTGISDEGCAHVSKNEWLSDLQLDLTGITDDGVRELVSCKHLRSLELYKTHVTDTCLVWLSDSKLEHLGLGANTITDAGMPIATEFSDLNSLDIQWTHVTDRGLRYLSESQKLNRLHLENTDISNSGLVHLLDLPLRTLSLNPKLNDKGLETLSRHEQLRHLAMWDCNVTSWHALSSMQELEVLLIDDSIGELQPLGSLQQLKTLMLWGDAFTSTELNRLRLALPDCQIETFKPYERADDEFRALVRWI